MHRQANKSWADIDKSRLSELVDQSESDSNQEKKQIYPDRKIRKILEWLNHDQSRIYSIHLIWSLTLAVSEKYTSSWRSLAVGNLIKSESKGKRRGQSQRLTKVKRV